MIDGNDSSQHAVSAVDDEAGLSVHSETASLDGSVAQRSAVGVTASPVEDEPTVQTVGSAVKVFFTWLGLALVLVGGLGGTCLGMLAWTAATGTLGFEVDSGTMSVSGIDEGMLTTATLFSSLATSAAGYVIYGKYSKKWWPAGGSSTQTAVKRALVGCSVGLAVVAVMQTAAFLLSLVGVTVESSDTGASVAGMMAWAAGSSVPWLMVPALLLTVGVVGPVAEELVFRGLIGRRIVDATALRSADGSRNWWQTAAVCLFSGLFFGVVHLTGFSVAGVEAAVLMTFVGGLFTWMSSVETRSLVPSVAAHIALNSSQLLLVLVAL